MPSEIRIQAVRIVRSYIDTPFLHMGRQPGIAIDCVGVLICLGRELGVFAPDFDIEAYTMSANEPRFMEQCAKFMKRKPAGKMEIGDVAAIKIKKVVSHVGVIADYHLGGFSIIHADNTIQKPRVHEMRLEFNRYFQLAGVFALPGID